jgi:hypothetical protein
MVWGCVYSRKRKDGGREVFQQIVLVLSGDALRTAARCQSLESQNESTTRKARCGGRKLTGTLGGVAFAFDRIVVLWVGVIMVS